MTTRRPRERPQPNDIRIELFTRFVTNVELSNHNNKNSPTAAYRAFADEITARFRSWKARYSLLLRAVEWCVPATIANNNNDSSATGNGNADEQQHNRTNDDDCLQAALRRLRAFAQPRYAQFYELDLGRCATCVECILPCDSHVAATMNEFVNGVQQQQNDNISGCRHSPNNAAAKCNNVERAAIFVVFGSAADSQQTAATQEQQQPALSTGAAAAATTSSQLRGLLLRNATPENLDLFIQRHLMRLIINMRIGSPQLDVFVPFTHEPLRRFSCVFGQQQEVTEEREDKRRTLRLRLFLVEPCQAFAANSYRPVFDALVTSSSDATRREVEIVPVLLGDNRDARTFVELAPQSSQHHRLKMVAQLNKDEAVALSSSRSSSLTVTKRGTAPSATLTLSRTDQQQQRRTIIAVFSGDVFGLDSFNDSIVSKTEMQTLLDQVVCPQQQQQQSSNALIFPTHSGYSWVSPQLDLAWVGIAGLTRKNILFAMQQQQQRSSSSPPVLFASALHRALLLENYSSNSSNSTGNRGPPQQQLQLQQHPQVFSSIAHFQEFCRSLPPHHPGRAIADELFTTAPLFLDIRAPRSFEALRISGSVSIPFTFPETERGAKRSELWISSLLLPHQPLVVIIETQDMCRAAFDRLSAVLPSSVRIEGFVTTQLLREQEEANSNNVNNIGFKQIPLTRGASPLFGTLASYEAVDAALHGGLAIDCRTPAEFSQGSHIMAANIPLSDLRYWLIFERQHGGRRGGGAADANRAAVVVAHESVAEWRATTATASAATTSVDSSLLLHIAPARMALFKHQHHHQPSHGGAAAASSELFLETEIPTIQKLKDVIRGSESCTAAATFVVFCAGGYRSRIFMSFFEAMIEASSSSPSSAAAESAAESVGPRRPPIRFADVGRGAVELMSQHAALWQVKDRSIMCVS